MTDDKMKIVDTPGHHRRHADHRKTADLQVAADDASGTDRRPGPNQGWQGFLIRI